MAQNNQEVCAFFVTSASNLAKDILLFAEKLFTIMKDRTHWFVNNDESCTVGK